MEFESWKPGSAQYANLDSEMRMRLTTLFFFCNRPTVGALMALGGDLGDAFKADGAPGSSAGDERALEATAESFASEADYEPGVPSCGGVAGT